MAGEAWRSHIPEETEATPSWRYGTGGGLPLVGGLFIGVVIAAAVIAVTVSPPRNSAATTQPSPAMGTSVSQIFEDEEIVVFKIQDGNCTIYIARGRVGGFTSPPVAMQLGEGCK